MIRYLFPAAVRAVVVVVAKFVIPGLLSSISLIIAFFDLSMSTFSASDFKLAKSICLAKFDVSTPVAFLISTLVVK